jgi:hypothetical protein
MEAIDREADKRFAQDDLYEAALAFVNAGLDSGHKANFTAHDTVNVVSWNRDDSGSIDSRWYLAMVCLLASARAAKEMLEDINP